MQTNSTPPMARRAARLIDVANLAKVSRATAARALGGYGKVTPENLRRVEKAAEALNYRGNGIARAMRAGVTKTIGLVVSDIANPFFEQASGAIVMAAARHGYQILIANSDEDLQTEIDAVRVLLEKRVDGLIVVPTSDTDIKHLRRIVEDEVPLVLLDRRVDALDVPSITTDDAQGSAEAIAFLADLGHKRIGMLVTMATISGFTARPVPASLSTVVDRLAGASEAAVAAGIPLQPMWTRYCERQHETAVLAAIDILSMNPRPTAVFTIDSDMALGLIEACKRLDLRIGPDVSLITFDDSVWARAVTPGVTVLARPVPTLGQAAVDQVMAQIAGHSAPRVKPFATNLVVRESVLRI